MSNSLLKLSHTLFINNDDEAYCFITVPYIRKLGFQKLIVEVTKMGGIAGVDARLLASRLTLLGTRVGCMVLCVCAGGL